MQHVIMPSYMPSKYLSQASLLQRGHYYKGVNLWRGIKCQVGVLSQQPAQCPLSEGDLSKEEVISRVS